MANLAITIVVAIVILAGAFVVTVALPALVGRLFQRSPLCGPSDMPCRLCSSLDRLRRGKIGFVIVEEPGTNLYIQFASGWAAGRFYIFFDLPTQALSPDTTNKAKAFFAERGILEPATFDTFDKPGGNVIGRQTSFQVDFGVDIDAATEFAILSLREIYGFDTGVTTFAIIEG